MPEIVSIRLETRSISHECEAVKIPVILIGVIMVFSLALSVWSNSDLVGGRYSLYMDELVSFDGTAKILHSQSLSELYQNLIGPDQRYGRSVWYFSALFSAIPERLAGESGQIFATRMGFSILHLLATSLLVFLFIEGWWWRALTLLLVQSLPTTHYFVTMVRPEPIVLLFLGLFFYFRKKAADASWVWAFLGFAFGTKVSVAPFAAVLIGLSLLAKFRSQQKAEVFFRSALKMTSCFLLGVFLCVPILFQFRWREYFESTFGSTAHGADDQAVTAIDWLGLIGNHYFVNPAVAILIGLGVLLLMASQHTDIKHALKKLFFEDDLFWGAGTLVLPIVIGVKRLWLLYLHTGWIFLLLFIVKKLENSTLKVRWAAPARAVLGLLLLVNGIYTFKRESLGLYQESATRTQSESFRISEERYRWILEELDKQAAQSQKQLLVHYDPSLFLPNDTERFRIVRFWGPYLDWSLSPDLVVFKLDQEAPVPESNREYESRKEAKRLRLAHVKGESNSSCELAPCYREVGSHLGVLVLARE